MKLKAPAAVAATARSPISWFLGICLAAFLTTISASAAAPQTGAGGLNPAEQWVVAQATAGEIADLSKKFPEEKDRKLSAHFLEELLTGTLPGLKLHRHGVRIIGAIIAEPIDLWNAQIRCQVSLDHCQFNKNVTFYCASFAETVLFDNSVFKADADFNSMKVGSGAFFRNAVFDGPVNFFGAAIASNFEADGTQFQNMEQGANFNSMKVGHTVFFRKAVFEGPVDFGSADIVSQFSAQGAKFQNKQQLANFDGMKVGDAAFFQNAVFDGPVTFGAANIAGQFIADEAQFQNKEASANFADMKVGQLATFKQAVFEGPVNFLLADIVGNFEVNGAQFQNMEQGANFNSMKVGGNAFFNDAVFEGSVDFSYAAFARLDLSGASWRGVAAQFYMQGTSYKYIRAAPEEPESHKALLTLADQSVYSADVYSNLEEFFLRQGYRGDADKAFIAGKRRERKENLNGLVGWLGSWLLDALVGYGRRPWQAGIPCAVLVALGCILFSPEKMEPQKPEDTPRVYSSFWYSLGLFLPFVDLQADKVWKPKADQTFLRNYMRVHIMLGWILIPIVLAALTGLIK
jgi:uncharacterized protein YjbI with pentapeptide repeats